MSATELDHLIKMANQIADNIAIGEEQSVAAGKVADHIQRFWARPMKQQLFEHCRANASGLNACAAAAIASLEQSDSNKQNNK
ncbi:formate dehydrogenase subunit delta [Oceanicoccus sp. KOV_DT_Chl]|uniref:formate dehydrogenase subunit delta n=1 Tax=Oceanicoccus sp. KOV_DT_Chl TaxID=1904639 RepID=UPI000C797A6A|nr:formate dehydrogenase subunit delta [Oceanicoccus sp. KOV_DT_Chl]